MAENEQELELSSRRRVTVKCETPKKKKKKFMATSLLAIRLTGARMCSVVCVCEICTYTVRYTHTYQYNVIDM